jgi:hypothetical protein
MSPMSLLTLPAATLRDAALRDAEARVGVASTQGEAGDRMLVLSVVLVLLAAGVALALAG